MHSLNEVIERNVNDFKTHFFVSMVDSIVHPKELSLFLMFSKKLRTNESAILVTSFVDDENPLTLTVDKNNYVQDFQVPLDEHALVTSGVYCFSPEALGVMKKLLVEGRQKMRTFLIELVKSGHRIKVFKASKTCDVDRPEDIIIADQFLWEIENDK